MSTGDFREQPVVLVFGDTPGSRARGEMAAAAAGWRLGCSLDLAGAPDRLDLQAGMDAVLVELDGEGNGVLDALLDRIERDARASLYRAIIVFPPEAIDAVTARIAHPDIALLCDPDPVERAAALAMALSKRGPWFSDSAKDGDDRLQHLGEEVARIAAALASLSSEALGRDSGQVHDRTRDYAAEPALPLSAETLRTALRARRMRERFFDAHLFADPAWDMLLDLMAARIEGEGVAVSSLCIAAVVPPTTALRWIRTMTEAGLFIRRADPLDGRRIFIELSDPAADGVTRYFAAVRGMGAMMV
ncbi:MarR family transcriptional regulator [Sphingobium boeckii]|uniref:MarR family transcriptional regulator n=1 Tax=Sphingobium boeckii TaxID=1082345 RepID=A0A7W9EDM8_9SPHN|nr:MarR family transcriptional regulator [Sphingobium boeckii]MBB5685277.1 hypothetical protein [Sphingobium boeckii]